MRPTSYELRAKQLLAAFDRLLKDSCRLLVPGARADALHLAIVKNCPCETLYTLDKGMADAAERLGIAVKMI